VKCGENVRQMLYFRVSDFLDLNERELEADDGKEKDTLGGLKSVKLASTSTARWMRSGIEHACYIPRLGLSSHYKYHRYRDTSL